MTLCATERRRIEGERLPPTLSKCLMRPYSQFLRSSDIRIWHDQMAIGGRYCRPVAGESLPCGSSSCSLRRKSPACATARLPAHTLLRASGSALHTNVIARGALPAGTTSAFVAPRPIRQACSSREPPDLAMRPAIAASHPPLRWWRAYRRGRRLRGRVYSNSHRAIRHQPARRNVTSGIPGVSALTRPGGPVRGRP